MSEILGIFDIDKTTISKDTREFLKNKEKQKKTVNATLDIPKSFIVTNDVIYICERSVSTLLKRARENEFNKKI